MPNIPSLQEMLKAGVHFGHRTSRWHPKMSEYIFGAKNGVHVIDIEQTQKMLEKVLNYVEDLTARGGMIMFIGTKPQNQDLVQKYAGEAGMPFVNTRWLGGTFTNFEQIERLIKNYLDLKDKRAKGELQKYTKLEQLQFDRKIDELEEKIGGISILKKLPEAVFVLDIRHDKTAVVEAKKRGVTVVALCDTNVNPSLVDMIIPANDDSIQSVTLLTRLVAEAAKNGKVRARTEVAPSTKKDYSSKIEVKPSSKETVNDLDDKIKDELVKEQAEIKK